MSEIESKEFIQEEETLEQIIQEFRREAGSLQETIENENTPDILLREMRGDIEVWEWEKGVTVSSWDQSIGIEIFPQEKKMRIEGIEADFFEKDKVLKLAHILNFITFHSQTLLRQEKGKSGTLEFLEKFKKFAFFRQKGLLYRFRSSSQDYVVRILRDKEENKKGKIVDGFYYLCPQEKQRKAVIDYLNAQVSSWKETL